MFRRIRPFPFIKQRDATECGTTCLAMIFKYYGLFNVQAALREYAGVASRGSDLATLARVADKFGFQTDGARGTFDKLVKVPLPLIVSYEGNHFVVVYKVSKTNVWVANPAIGKEQLSRDEFVARWNGIMLIPQPRGELFSGGDAMEFVRGYANQQQSLYTSFYKSLLTPFRRIFLEIILSSIILVALGLALPFFTQSILDSVLVFQNQDLLYAILVGMIGVLVLQILLTYIRQLLLAQFRVEFELEFFSRFFKHFLQLTQGYFDSHKREDFIQRFQENMKIRSLFNAGTLQSLLDVILLVLLVPVLLTYNIVLGGIATGFLAVVVITTIAFTPKIHHLQERVFHENAHTMGTFLDTLLGMLTVKLSSIEMWKFWEWRVSYKQALNKVMTATRMQILMTSILRTLTYIGYITVYWFGAFLAFNNTMTIGEYVAFISIFTVMMNAATTVSDLWFVITDMSVTFARLNDVFHQVPEQQDILTQVTTLQHCGITATNLWFSYQESDHHILRDVNFTIKPGEHIGIVGRNGSGKTTLVKLLVKLYESYKGSITLGDTELRQYHPHYLRQHVAMLPQEVYLFNGTILDNIRIANPAATPEEVIRAAKLADLHSFVMDLYLGYNQKIGDSGDSLSGGQKLKIAFARLFLSSPDVIILDEASSALDVLTEKIILNNVKMHFADKTIISVAHRLSTLQHVDKIFVLDNGTIAEQGTHQELILSNGLYHQFMKTYVDL